MSHAASAGRTPVSGASVLWAWLSVLTYLAGALVSVLNPVMVPCYIVVVALAAVAVVLWRRPSSLAARRAVGVLLLVALLVGVVVALASIMGSEQTIGGLRYASYFLFVVFFVFPAVTAISLLRGGPADPRG